MTTAIPTEDKRAWCAEGERYELEFLRLVEPLADFDAALNPDKATDPYAPDLVVNGQLADLKCQREPFFTANRYGRDPLWTVTFNRKDVERYARNYPDIAIFFWVGWPESERYSVRVAGMAGIWATSNREIASWVEAGAPEHSYRNRQDDTAGNARSSYLLDLREMEPVLAYFGWRAA